MQKIHITVINGNAENRIFFDDEKTFKEVLEKLIKILKRKSNECLNFGTGRRYKVLSADYLRNSVIEIYNPENHD